VTFFPSWQTAAPAPDSLFGIITDAPASSSYSGTLILLAGMGGATALPFLGGRWWGRRRRTRGLLPLDAAVIVAVAAAVPSYYLCLQAFIWSFEWRLGMGLLCTLYAAAGISFVAGARAGFSEEWRLAARAGFAWAILSLFLVLVEPRLVHVALALGLLASSVSDEGAFARGLVPRGWTIAQAVFSILVAPPSLLIASALNL
jgi:hypothetical protein